MNEKRSTLKEWEDLKFNCVLGKDYHIINNNVDNMTYFLQDGNDVVLVINLLNRLVEEKEYFERKKEYFLSKWSIVNAKNIQLRQEIDDLKEENEQLKKQNIEYEEVQCKIMNYIIDKGLGSEFAKFLREAEDE